MGLQPSSLRNKSPLYYRIMGIIVNGSVFQIKLTNTPKNIDFFKVTPFTIEDSLYMCIKKTS